MPKECPPGKVLNPKTNRCVSVDGKIGKALLKESASAKKSSTSSSKSLSSSSSAKQASPVTPPPQRPNNKPEWWVDEDLMKEARIWVRAPWRDMENQPLQGGAKNEKWVELYSKYAPALNMLFRIRNTLCALDTYSLRRFPNNTKPVFLTTEEARRRDYTLVNVDKLEERIEVIRRMMNDMNRIELALMISNCVIATFSWGRLDSIENLCYDLLKKYYDKDTKKIPYYKTLHWKVINYVYQQDYGFFTQLASKWKEIGTNMEKYPFNELLLKK